MVYVCAQCGNDFPKWSGQCAMCNAWGTLKEQNISVNKSHDRETRLNKSELVPFSRIDHQTYPRVKVGITEIDRVLGGGLVAGSIILLCGDPGIGKSTLVLQISSAVAQQKKKVIYVSGEESGEQIKMRFARLGLADHDVYFLGETNVDGIFELLETMQADAVIIDSIQTMYSGEFDNEAGSVTQIRACTQKLLLWAKHRQIPVFIIGHITKEGVVAGPKTLEHLVDVVLYLEGDENYDLRLLRATKNRFGATNEVGIFEMREKGLTEVQNPSELFLSREQNHSGASRGVVIEGSRAFVVEVQALVQKTHFGYPQRRSIGFDQNRLQLILAVLSKRLKMPLGQFDVYLNLAGGIKTEESALDMAVAAAVYSSLNDSVLPPDTVYIGEIGLGGEIRSVRETERRVKEAARLGFKTIYAPYSERLPNSHDARIIAVRYIKDIVKS